MMKKYNFKIIKKLKIILITWKKNEYKLLIKTLKLNKNNKNIQK